VAFATGAETESTNCWITDEDEGIVVGDTTTDCGSSPAEFDLTGLPEGTYAINARARDGDEIAGDTDSRTLVIDTTAPGQPSFTTTPKNPTSLTTASFAFTGEVGATFECSFDGGSFVACNAGTSAKSSLSEGAHSFTVRQTDRAGNRDGGSERTYGPWTIAAAATPTQTVSAGGTASSDLTGAGATSSNPVVTAVTSPTGGDVTISSTSTPTTAAPATYSLLGTELVIEAPAATVNAPLVLTFTLDAASIPAGTDIGSLTVLRDGAPIDQLCAGGTGATTANPDPCIKSRTAGGSGDVTIVVLSSHASKWVFGKTTPVTNTDTTQTKPVDKTKPTVKRGKLKCGKAKKGVKTCKLPITATDASGIAKVEINLVRKLDKKGKKCQVWNGKLFKTMTCAKARKTFIKITAKAGKYVLTTKGKTNGKYDLIIRVRDKVGNVTTTKKASIKL
jgi:hypothetical protein